MTRDRRQQILALALPIIGGMTSQNILNLVDTAMVGALGAAPLAAVGMASFLSFMAVAAITGLSSAVQATAARRYGENLHDETAVPLNGGLMISLFIGVPLTVLLVWLAPEIFALVNDDPEVQGEGVPYLQARLMVIAAVGMNFSFRGFWNGIGRSKIYLYTLLFMHSINIFLNYCLIFGNFGFPELGTLGAGIGTAISVLIGTVTYFVMAWTTAHHSGFLHRRPSTEQLKKLLKLGAPGSIQQFMFAAGFTALFWIIGMVGTQELAVANVLINITLVAVLPGIGFGLAAASLVGHALGRGDADDAFRWGWDVVKVGAVAFLLLGVPMLLLTRPILGIFLHDPALIELGVWPLRMIGAGIVIDGGGLILMQALYGAGDAKAVMVVNIVMQWLLFLPVAYLIGPVMGFGLLTIWVLMMTYRTGQAVAFGTLWQRRHWQHIEV